jgi:hypothetical protein
MMQILLLKDEENKPDIVETIPIRIVDNTPCTCGDGPNSRERLPR